MKWAEYYCSVREDMRTISITVLGLLLLGCNARNSPPQETITGFVVEKRAGIKSFDSWNAPSDPYYVLEGKEGNVTLRPSSSIPAAKIATLKGKRVLIKGYHTDGEPYRPTGEGEQYPMEPADDLGTNGAQAPIKMQPANRSVGFVVTRILEMK